MPAPDSSVPLTVLRAATEVVDGIQEGMAKRGFDDVRPAHGFAFVRLSRGGATVVELAAHLGISKQAASQLVEQLVQRGYVARELDPDDGRAWSLVLTDRGVACTKAAEAAATEVAKRWRKQLGAPGWSAFEAALGAVVTPGLIRPTW